MSEEKYQTRGAQNPYIIDLIEFDKGNDRVFFHIFELREWKPQSDKELRDIEEKLNRYLGYILDGFFIKEYPQYQGKNICLRINHASPLSSREQHFFEAVQSFAETEGFEFEAYLLSEEEVKRWKSEFKAHPKLSSDS